MTHLKKSSRTFSGAEKQLLKALPKMAKAASNEDLKAGFEEHLEQTKVHVERIEKVFKLLGKTTAPRPVRRWKV